MNEELSSKLRKNYPELFNNVHFHTFECHDGWYSLINDLSRRIVKSMKDNLMDYCDIPIYVEQVKEKYGGLRYYMSRETEEISRLIEQYQRMSYGVCEICGNAGEVRTGGWVRTRCDEHYEQ